MAKSVADEQDLLSESLEILYDHVPVACGSSGSIYTYHPQDGGLAITLKTPDTHASNWALHATSIWSASIYLADHIRDLQIDRRSELAKADGRPFNILELGAAAGLPSILIATRYSGVLVTCSDYPDDSLIRTLEENVARNEASDRCRVQPYAWGSDPSALLSPKIPDGAAQGFDLVLAADTLWNRDSHFLFLESLQHILKRSPDARAYLVAGLHTGRYVLQTFLSLLYDAGFILEEIMERRVGYAEERPWSIDRAEGEDEQERRRWIVWIVLKWREV
ncbi:putative methyltransferase-domain-containing protein [Trametes gibbosa]|nr:putative methyltransferase-domain-containing protein [Trametes gibbosa]